MIDRLQIFGASGLQSVLSLGDSAAQIIVGASLVGTALILVLLVMHRRVERFLGLTWLYWIWLLILFRFVLFFVPESPLSALNLLPVSEKIAATENSRMVQIGPGDPFPDVAATMEAEPPVTRETRATATESKSAITENMTLWTWVFAGWCFGVVLFAALFLSHWARIRRIISNSNEAGTELQRRFERLKALTGTRFVRLRETNELRTPAVTGVIRPVVLFPECCSDALTEAEQDLVLLHELTHVKHRDGLTGFLVEWVKVLHWFNPFVRHAAGRLEICRELRCDEAVIEVATETKGSSAAQEYGRTILKILEMNQQQADVRTDPRPILLGSFLGKEKEVMQRIAKLAGHSPIVRQRNRFAGALLVLLVVAVGFTSAQTTRDQEESSSTPDQPQSSTTLQAVERLAELPRPVPQPLLLPPGQTATHQITLTAGQALHQKFDWSIPEVVVSDPELLKITPISPCELLFQGLKTGATSVAIHSGDDNRTLCLEVVVTASAAELQTAIQKEFPGIKVNAQGTVQGISLVGTVETEGERSRLIEFAESFGSTDVLLDTRRVSLNRLVAIKLELFEVSKERLAARAITRTDADTVTTERITSIGQLISDAGPGGTRVGFADDGFEAVMTSLEGTDVVELIDQPVLVASADRPAKFISGGEVPISVFDNKGRQTIEFRPFGTILNLRPLVRADGRIEIQVNAELSKLDQELADATGAPGFNVRSLQTGTLMSEGQRFLLIFEDEKDGKPFEVVVSLTPQLLESVESLEKNAQDKE